MEKELLLSICIPTYNRADIVEDSVNRFLNIFKKCDWIEIVVNDNCSTDGTMERLSSIKDDKLHLYRNESNIRYLNLIECHKKARGKFTLLIADEDELIVDNLDEIKEQLRSCNDVGVFLMNTLYENGKMYRYRPFHVFRKNTEETYLKVYNQLAYTSGIIYNREILLKMLKRYENNFIKIDAYSVFPHTMMGVCCVMDGDYAPLRGIRVVRVDKDAYKDKRDLIIGGKYADGIDGRMVIAKGWIDLFNLLEIDNVKKGRLMNEPLFVWLNFFKRFYKEIQEYKGSIYMEMFPELYTEYRKYDYEKWKSVLYNGYCQLTGLIHKYKADDNEKDIDIYESAYKEVSEWLEEQQKIN